MIPGRKGEPVTAADYADAIDQSLANGDALRAAGLAIIEVYHQGEPAAHLRKLLARRQPGELLGLGTRKDAAKGERRAWLDACFAEILRDGSGRVAPTHGFGVAWTRLYRRYPWWSCDSTAWRVPTAYGATYDRRGVQVRIAAPGAMSAMPAEGRARLAAHHERRILAQWAVLEAETNRLWRARGVRFAP